MTEITEIIKTERLYFDGGTGTVLQSMGLPAGTAPEIWNLTNPEKITALHRAYLDAGANIIKTNTFGVNCEKYENYEALISAALDCAESAVNGRENAFIAFDMGPTGRLLKPLGDLDFEEAVALFASNIKAMADRADLILIETMNDSLETKEAVLAAKENSNLPIFVTNVYDESGKLMTGASPEAMVAMLESLGVAALGMNCSLGPDKMLNLVPRFTENASVPIIVNPNAGLPVVIDGKTVFNTDGETFADYMAKMAEMGACILGGCCGTTPDYIAKTVAKTEKIPYSAPEYKNKTVVSSCTHAVEVGDSPVLIGERINPTGKPRFKEALRSGDMNYVVNEAVKQVEAGVHILDVNVGLPEIDEKIMMKNAVEAVQTVTDVPLQLDSNNPAVLENAMRIYNGKPLVNSVNGEAESMRRIFPLVKKYGGAVIALTMDNSGIPETAEKRVEIAEKIIGVAAEYGIGKKDIIVDPLALTVSSNQQNALVTLEAVRLLGEKGIKISLGVSNISFGLPKREIINSTFFANALERGLNCAIMNPFAQGMMDVYHSFKVLHGLDAACADYINYANSTAETVEKSAKNEEITLHKAVLKGMKESAVSAAKELLKGVEPLEVINSHIIPALNEIGGAFEAKKAFLPQLLMSAEAASGAFEEVKARMPKTDSEKGRGVVLATVKGDIHDIGKNIVKVMLESYGFTVYDLGRDVAPEAVLAAVENFNCKLVGLSALMTTTVPAMAETIKLLRENQPDVKIMVGGAVLNQEYSDMISADYYGVDAMASVRIAEDFYKN
ncbi:MAG: homocysteine S-methyltransferase family protein [Clostridia bacterium]|nr:homocysteine S-methyltransferase family protein [Clostridia bacterium]